MSLPFEDEKLGELVPLLLHDDTSTFNKNEEDIPPPHTAHALQAHNTRNNRRASDAGRNGRWWQRTQRQIDVWLGCRGWFALFFVTLVTNVTIVSVIETRYTQVLKEQIFGKYWSEALLGGLIVNLFTTIYFTMWESRLGLVITGDLAEVGILVWRHLLKKMFYCQVAAFVGALFVGGSSLMLNAMGHRQH